MKLEGKKGGDISERLMEGLFTKVWAGFMELTGNRGKLPPCLRGQREGVAIRTSEIWPWLKDAATIEPWPGSLLPPFDLLLMHVIDQIQPPGSQRGVESESGGRNGKKSSTQLQFVFKKLRVFYLTRYPEVGQLHGWCIQRCHGGPKVPPSFSSALLRLDSVTITRSWLQLQEPHSGPTWSAKEKDSVGGSILGNEESFLRSFPRRFFPMPHWQNCIHTGPISAQGNGTQLIKICPWTRDSVSL